MKGNFRRAATHKQNLAELYEVELGDQKRAMEAYELAAGWYENDNAEQYVISLKRILFSAEEHTDMSTQASEQTLPQTRRHLSPRSRLLQSHLELRARSEKLDK